MASLPLTRRPNFVYIYQVERKLLKNAIAKFSHYISGDVLDVGGGSFHRYAGLFKKKTKYSTLDINPESHPDVLGSATAIPVKEGSFDSIVCTQVIGDVLEPSKVIKEFHRVLKSGGTILLTEAFLNEMHDEPNDFWRFTNFVLKNMFEEAGFKILFIERVGGFFAVQAQMKTRYFINRFNLYRKPILGRFFSLVFKIMGEFSILCDRMDKSQANQKFVLDWIVVAEKI